MSEVSSNSTTSIVSDSLSQSDESSTGGDDVDDHDDLKRQIDQYDDMHSDKKNRRKNPKSSKYSLPPLPRPTGAIKSASSSEQHRPRQTSPVKVTRISSSTPTKMEEITIKSSDYERAFGYDANLFQANKSDANSDSCNNTHPRSVRHTAYYIQEIAKKQKPVLPHSPSAILPPKRKTSPERTISPVPMMNCRPRTDDGISKQGKSMSALYQQERIYDSPTRSSSPYRSTSFDPSILTPAGRDRQLWKSNHAVHKRTFQTGQQQTSANNDDDPNIEDHLQLLRGDIHPPQHDDRDQEFDWKQQRRKLSPRQPVRRYSNEVEKIVGPNQKCEGDGSKAPLSPIIISASSKRTQNESPESYRRKQYRSNSDSAFKKHGVIQYMRPDGLDFGNKRNYASRGKPSSAASDEAILQKKHPNRTSLEHYNKRLEKIAKSSFPDKANRAGKVLKAMKADAVELNNTTRNLLAECTGIYRKPLEPKIHEVDVNFETVEETVIEKRTQKPIQITRKKVRFSPINTTRIIRRRRSISSTERWDDPLTPPKKISLPLDLAMGRFSTGLPTDDRPSLPTRSNSMSSFMSNSSSSSGSDGNSDKRNPNSDELAEKNAYRFQLPFSDVSPITVTRKVLKGPRRTDRNATKPYTIPQSAPPSQVDVELLAPPEIRGGSDPPSVPVRTSGGDDSSSDSPENSSETAKIKEDIVSSAIGKPPLPPHYSVPLATPPQAVRKVQRRYSIGSTAERRADNPLTPPRRVSAPLEIFLAQCSLRQSAFPDTNDVEQKNLGSPVDSGVKKDASKSKTLSTKAPATRTARHIGDSTIVVTPLERHQASVSETWTKINLPRRARSVSYESDDASHTSSSTNLTVRNRGRNYRSISPLSRASSNENRNEGDDHSRRSSLLSSSFRTPTSQWMRVNSKQQQLPPRINSRNANIANRPSSSDNNSDNISRSNKSDQVPIRKSLC
jgi:hypothetical protein